MLSLSSALSDVKVLDFQSEEVLTEAYLNFYKENVLEISE